MALISHIAYQGLPSGKEWTKQYQVEYSLDGTRFDVYKSGSLPYEFKENVNEKGVQVGFQTCILYEPCCQECCQCEPRESLAN
eukprot:m.68500 g.68500  ORF g.68500 m.68500 type:complete len:83 (+) comp35521_c0_seq10:405-653(+)